jgi:hypothetical protein
LSKGRILTKEKHQFTQIAKGFYQRWKFSQGNILILLKDKGLAKKKRQRF